MSNVDTTPPPEISPVDVNVDRNDYTADVKSDVENDANIDDDDNSSKGQFTVVSTPKNDAKHERQQYQEPPQPVATTTTTTATATAKTTTTSAKIILPLKTLVSTLYNSSLRNRYCCQIS
jgi:hypothetical protein